MSMRSESLQLVISGDGQALNAELGKSERQVRTFSGRVGAMMSGIGRGIAGMAAKLSPLALIGGGAGIIMAARNLADYQDTLSSLGITARLSTEDMMALDRRVHDLGYTTGQTREAMVGALRSMASNIDTEFAVESIEDIAKAATAMSMNIEDVAGAYTVFRRDMRLTSAEATELFNAMVAIDQSLPVDSIARSVQTIGLSRDNFASYLALIHASKGVYQGSADAAAAAFDRIVNRLRTNRRAMRIMGNDLFDEEGSIRDFRAFAEKMGELTDGQLRQVAGRGDAGVFRHFRNSAALKDIDDYIKRAEDAGFVTDSFTRKQREARFQFNALAHAAKEFAGVALGPALEDVTRWLNELTSNPEAMARFRQEVMGVAGAIGDIGRVAVGLTRAATSLNDFVRGSREWRDFRDNTLSAVTNMSYAERRDFGRPHGIGHWKIAGTQLLTGLGIGVSRETGRQMEAMVNDYVAANGRRPVAIGERLYYNNRETNRADRTQNAQPPTQNNISIEINQTNDRTITTVNGANTTANTTVNRGRL